MDDTLHLEGEEDAAALDLPAAGAVAVSPLSYSLDIGVSDGGLFATGWVRVKVRMVCVVCLAEFEREIEVSPISLQRELTGNEVIDLTPLVREDVHLAVPAHPRCGTGDACQAACKTVLHANQYPIGDAAWSALDKLKSLPH